MDSSNNPANDANGFEFDLKQHLDRPATTIVSYNDAIEKVRRTIEADPVMIGALIAAIGLDRLREAISPRQSVLPFPAEIGTVECSIWDNQPFAKAKKSTTDKSRERPARFGITLKATLPTNTKPLTGKPEFKSTGDLFTAEEVRARLAKTWKSIDAADRAKLENDVLPLADASGLLIGRLFLSGKGVGKHWHAGHFLLIDEAALMARELNGAILIVNDRLVGIPAFSTTDGTGDPFPFNERVTQSGDKKTSTCVLQSRSSNLPSLQKTWSTGICE